MNTNRYDSKGTPHLTPESLVGQRFGKDALAGIAVALVGFCPRPNLLDKYDPQHTSDQYFIHVSPASVQIGNYDGIKYKPLSCL